MVHNEKVGVAGKEFCHVKIWYVGEKVARRWRWEETGTGCGH